MKSFMKQLTKTFLAGLAVGIPLIITVWVIIQLGLWLNGLALQAVGLISSGAAQAIAEWPGLGLVTILVTIFILITLIGAAARFWFTAGILSRLERVLERLPLVKTIYTSVRDMLRFFGGAEILINEQHLGPLAGKDDGGRLSVADAFANGASAGHDRNFSL